MANVQAGLGPIKRHILKKGFGIMELEWDEKTSENQKIANLLLANRKRLDLMSPTEREAELKTSFERVPGFAESAAGPKSEKDDGGEGGDGRFQGLQPRNVVVRKLDRMTASTCAAELKASFEAMVDDNDQQKKQPPPLDWDRGPDDDQGPGGPQGPGC